MSEQGKPAMPQEGEAKTYATDDQGHFCRHCGRAGWRHHRVIGGGNFCDAPPTIATSQEEAQHPDDRAVDLFAANMKTKLAKAREKGRGGWDDPSQCTVPHLQQLLHEHLAKGDPVDVANFCMMLAYYGAATTQRRAQGDAELRAILVEGLKPMKTSGRFNWAQRARDVLDRISTAPAPEHVTAKPATSRSAPSVNCFGIPDECNGWTITQGPDDRFYARTGDDEHGADTWDDLAEILATTPARNTSQIGEG